MRISDWSSDVCSSDLIGNVRRLGQRLRAGPTDKGIAIGAAQLLDAIGRRDGDANVARRVIIVPLLTNLYFLASARRVADVLAELGAPGVLIYLLALLHDVFERRRINGRAIGVRAHHEFPGFFTNRLAPPGIEK